MLTDYAAKNSLQFLVWKVAAWIIWVFLTVLTTLATEKIFQQNRFTSSNCCSIFKCKSILCVLSFFHQMQSISLLVHFGCWWYWVVQWSVAMPTIYLFSLILMLLAYIIINFEVILYITICFHCMSFQCLIVYFALKLFGLIFYAYSGGWRCEWAAGSACSSLVCWAAGAAACFTQQSLPFIQAADLFEPQESSRGRLFFGFPAVEHWSVRQSLLPLYSFESFNCLSYVLCRDTMSGLAVVG